MENHEFDVEAFRKEAIKKLQDGEGLLGENGAFTPLLKSFLEQALEGELDAHLAEEDAPNRKNGRGKKRVRTSLGEIDI
ncbi:IS256 family transposase, partial [Neolewinella litorea]